MFLLIDERRPPPPPPGRPDHVRIAWRVGAPTATAVALGVVAATASGATGALAAIGALAAGFKALDGALPYPNGLREHKQ
ncbi:MAG TPA: hypothetical protein VGJ70_25085 [Solirubrobacteraceae bacterium]